jgi:hypothetical protein
MVRFEGFRQLIDAIGGVDVTLEKPVTDGHFQMTRADRLKYFGGGPVHYPRGTSHLDDGTEALVFSRTRYGDNDFERNRRQMLVVKGGIAKVVALGATELTRLRDLAQGQGIGRLHTDLPWSGAPALLQILARADLAESEIIVLGPTTYSRGSADGRYFLRMDVIRALCDRLFAPVPPIDPPPTAASPSPGSSPTTSP